jgi:hypothetical protein
MPLASRSEYFRTNLFASTTLSRSFIERILPWDLVPYDVLNMLQRPTLEFHPQLCGTYRLSQPLGALLRDMPFRPCFVPVTPLSFGLQRFSLCGSE